jgi:hypothetical protein
MRLISVLCLGENQHKGALHIRSENGRKIGAPFHLKF